MLARFASRSVLVLKSQGSRRATFVALPIVFLLGDMLAFPAVWESRRPVGQVSIVSLVTHRVIPLGIFRAHQIYVSIDSIRSRKYLSYLEGSPNALVISHFVNTESQTSRAGALGQAVLEKLRRVSPENSVRLRDMFDKMGTHKPGEFADVGLKVAREEYSGFPIDRLFVLLLEDGRSSQGKDAVAKGIREIIKVAERDKVWTLIIPAVGYTWEDKNSLQVSDVFEPVFASLSVSDLPRGIYLSLYTDWPTVALEEAVASINRAWERNVQRQYPGIAVPYRGEVRVTLLALSTCLLVCSFRVRLTLKNGAIVAGSFVGLAAGAVKTVEFWTPGLDQSYRSLMSMIMIVALAVGLPFFVAWDIKKLFGGGGR